MNFRKIVGLILFLLLVLGVLEVNVPYVFSAVPWSICICAEGNLVGTDKIYREGNFYTFTSDIIVDFHDVGIMIEKSNVLLDGNGYSLFGSGSGKGIFWENNVNNVTVKNLTVIGFSRGINFISSSNNKIVENKMGNITLFGIELKSSSNGNKIIANYFNNSRENVLCRAIYVSSSSNNKIQENTILNNFCGILLDGYSQNNIVEENKISTNGNGIQLDSSFNIISRNFLVNNTNGLHLRYRSQSNNILENEVFNNNIGIYIECSSNNLFRNNTLYNNTYNLCVDSASLSNLMNDIDKSNTVDGKPIIYWVNQHDKFVPTDAGYVGLFNCTNILVENLNLNSNGQGVLIAYTSNSTITKNNITCNIEGILSHFSYNNTINKNNIKTNTRGIHLNERSQNNSILVNYIEENNFGMYLFVASNNRIIKNQIVNNNVGIHFSKSSDNLIYNNNFINNTSQVGDSSQLLQKFYPSVNVWDNGYKGNYWCNYTCLEEKSDGIGNIPHRLYNNNSDNYPLTHPVDIPVFEPPFSSKPESTPPSQDPIGDSPSQPKDSSSESENESIFFLIIPIVASFSILVGIACILIYSKKQIHKKNALIKLVDRGCWVFVVF